MSLAKTTLAKADDLNIKHEGQVHSGKVRSVYWLTPEDSKRVIEHRDYAINENSQLGVMVITDKISAFDCNWKGEDGLEGIPGKGAALNTLSEYWFDQMGDIAPSHLLEVPHPLVWIVEKAEPIMVEAIARGYITGSMWRAYEKGARNFCGITLPEGLKKNQPLDDVLLTPTTKGIMKGISGVPEEDDTNVTGKQLRDHYEAFGFKSVDDVELLELATHKGFNRISQKLHRAGHIFVDTKFEFGYVRDIDNQPFMIYIDEVGTLDSSRIWLASEYTKGKVLELSKEVFREHMLIVDKDLMTDKSRMDERKQFAETYRVPLEVMVNVSDVYRFTVEDITGRTIPMIDDARGEIMDVMSEYKLAK